MKIAYLIATYPMVSTSFIRREINVLKALNYQVERYAIRRPTILVDEKDIQESNQTNYLLDAGKFGLLIALVSVFFKSPKRFIQALILCIKCGIGSDRGLLINLIYFAEACVFYRSTQRQGIDHVHVHFSWNSTTVAMLSEVLGGASFSFTVHGPEDFDKVKAIALPEKIKRAKFVAAISSFTKSQLYRWSPYSDWDKIKIIHCGLEPNFLEQKLTPLPTENRLVCIGRLTEQKGQILLLQALKKLKDKGIKWELVLVGDGDMRSDVEAAVTEYDLGNQVRLTGWATEAEVKQEINQAKALVLPSFAEGLPVVMMESLAMGRPVVSTYIAGIPELVKPGISGWLVPAGDTETLSTAIEELLQTPGARLTQMAEAGRELVLANHNIVTECQALGKLFEAVVAEKDT